MPDDDPKSPTKVPIVVGSELVPFFANDYLVTIFSDMFRLTLSELVYGVVDTYPRAAVVMHPRRAVEFAQAILKTYEGLANPDPTILAMIKDGK